jgi:hypothetical protein
MVGFGILLEVGAHVLEPLFDLYIKKIKQTYSSAGFDDMTLSSFNSGYLYFLCILLFTHAAFDTLSIILYGYVFILTWCYERFT